MTSSVLAFPRRDAAGFALPERQLRRYHPHVQAKVRALAMQHARIADLAVSFPGLLFALAVPRAGRDSKLALAHVIDGRSLAKAAAAAGIPLWLRNLPPEAFIFPIAGLPDDEVFRRQIANHLPPSAKLSPIWLQAVTELAGLAHSPAAAWIARELIRAPRFVNPAGLRLVGLWAWFSTQPSTLGHTLIDRTWAPAMRLDTARAAANDWRTLLSLHLNLGSQPIADMWLQAGRVAGYDFVPLTSTADIAEEAEAMQNCLRTYGYNLAHNRSRLWSIRQHGRRVATLKVATRYRDPLPSIVELKGRRNGEMPAELWWAARQWLHMHDLSRVDMAQRIWGTVPLDRGTWRALWRPYWLAKRRIPEWLPIAPSRDALEDL
ncbi:hypothetical protein QMZ05_14525 [Bradyrhizobium sp. INPA03-11B]|uniref:hypothetical protein n=1 Tax=Bradyrhizobium sp. INPA03-11B TaxID=418598 RepID=UPI00338F7610